MLYKIKGTSISKNNALYIEHRKKYLWLMRTIMGYTSQEAIQLYDKRGIYGEIAKDLDYTTVQLIIKPFYEHDCILKVFDINDVEIPISEFNITIEKPKMKYYNNPVMREHNKWTSRDENGKLLLMRYNAEQESALKCPFCKSTNVKKIGVINRSASIGLFGLASSKIGKQWQCNSCKSAF